MQHLCSLERLRELEFSACIREGSGQTLEQPPRACRWLQESWRGTFYKGVECQEGGNGFKLN